MNKKGIITTIIGSVFLLGFIAILIYYFASDMSIEAFVIATTSWIAVCKFVADYFSKDSNKSHTFGDPIPDIPPDDKDQKPPTP